MKQITKTQIISKSYMTGLILKCGLFFAVGLILTGVVLFYSSHQPLGPSYQESFARLAQLKQEMLIKSMITYLILTSIIMAGVIFITVIYSHRVVGPLVGLKRIIGNIKGGDLTTPATLRQKDAIKPMADAMNSLMEKYRQQLSAIQKITSDMNKALKTPSEHQGEDLKNMASEIKGLLGHIKL